MNRKNNFQHKKHQKTPFKPQKTNIPSNQIWIFGKHSFYSSLKKQKRNFYQILVSENNEQEFLSFLESNPKLKSKVSSLIKICDGKTISSNIDSPSPSTHQGYAILASKLKTKTQLELLTHLYDLKENGQKLPKLLILDQVTDPHNIGAIIRSAVAFGVKELVLSEHNCASETSTTIKTSVGLIEEINITVVTNINNLIEKLKKIDYWVAGLAGEGKSSIADLKTYENLALIVGSEGDGIRKLVKKNCDLLTKIDIMQECESLNASVATAIALYELNKK